MSDYVRLHPWSVVTWAEETARASRSIGEPPASEGLLAQLENILLVNRRNNAKRLAHPLKGRFWVACRPSVYILLLTPPAFAPFAMPAGQMAAGAGAYKPERVFLTALAVCLLGMAYLGIFCLRWRRQPVRRRDAVATLFSFLYAGFTALGLVMCLAFADDFDVPIDWYVLPLIILLALCIASVVYQLKSPPNPAWGTVLSMGGEMSPNKTRFETHRLHPDDQARMLDERDRAVRVLVENGLLPDVDPDELATRPLGLLHLAPVVTGTQARPTNRGTIAP